MQAEGVLSARSNASTFTLPNAAIALEIGEVTGPDEIFRWDGVDRSFEPWKQGHTLASGMAASAVPVYPEVAPRIGAARMTEWLEGLAYGNADMGG